MVLKHRMSEGPVLISPLHVYVDIKRKGGVNVFEVLGVTVQ